MVNKFVSDWDRKLLKFILNGNPILKEKIEENSWKQFWEIVTVNWNIAIKMDFLNTFAEADIDCGLKTIDEKFVGAIRGDQIQVLSVPKCVTKIDEYAFYGCDNLNRIKIPDSVRTIGEMAFWACNKLKKIVLPKMFERELYDIGIEGLPYCNVEFFKFRS